MSKILAAIIEAAVKSEFSEEGKAREAMQKETEVKIGELVQDIPIRHWLCLCQEKDPKDKTDYFGVDNLDSLWPKIGLLVWAKNSLMVEPDKALGSQYVAEISAKLLTVVGEYLFIAELANGEMVLASNVGTRIEILGAVSKILAKHI